MRLSLLTCYDLRFPVWSRYGRAGEYDAIIVVANWPESRQQPWRVLTRARAIENQCYLIGCNRVGDDQWCHYSGESLVCGARGETLVSCPANEPSACTADLDFEALSMSFEKFSMSFEKFSMSFAQKSAPCVYGNRIHGNYQKIFSEILV